MAQAVSHKEGCGGDIRVVGVCGNVRRPSKTRTLVETIANELRSRTAYDPSVFDLSDLGPGLGMASDLKELTVGGRDVVSKIAAADGLIIGSPVYKGAYAGLFKHLFDLMPPDCLRGKPVILTATGGGNRHALMIEHHLRPLFGFFEALSMPTVIYASETDFQNGEISSDAVRTRIDLAVRQLHQFMSAGSSRFLPN